MKISATGLRKNLYNLLDRVIKTGIPIEIERKGVVLKIVLDKKKSKLDNLEEHNIINGNPEEIANIKWEAVWKKGVDL